MAEQQRWTGVPDAADAADDDSPRLERRERASAKRVWQWAWAVPIRHQKWDQLGLTVLEEWTSVWWCGKWHDAAVPLLAATAMAACVWRLAWVLRLLSLLHREEEAVLHLLLLLLLLLLLMMMMM